MLNLLPHKVTVISSGVDVVYPISGKVARATSLPQKEVMRFENGVSVVTPQQFERVEGMDEVDPWEDVLVSMVVAPLLAKTWKGMVLVPDSGPSSAIRDAKGQVVKVRRLVCYNSHSE